MACTTDQQKDDERTEALAALSLISRVFGYHVRSHITKPHYPCVGCADSFVPFSRRVLNGTSPDNASERGKEGKVLRFEVDSHAVWHISHNYLLTIYFCSMKYVCVYFLSICLSIYLYVCVCLSLLQFLSVQNNNIKVYLFVYVCYCFCSYKMTT